MRLKMLEGLSAISMFYLAALAAEGDNAPTTLPTVEGHIISKAIPESSGLVPADLKRGLFFTQNDSGNPAAVWLIRRSGTALGFWKVDNAPNVDWEEMTADANRLYVADTGDNAAKRPVVYVYEFARPALPEDATESEKQFGTLKPTRRFTLKYPDRPHDCESLFLLNGRAYVITKERKIGGPVLFSFDVSEDAPTDDIALRREAELPIIWPVTGAAISDDGKQLAVCTVGGPYLFDLSAGVGAIEKQTPTFVIRPAVDMESICFVEGGLLTTRERGDITFFPFSAFKAKP